MDRYTRIRGGSELWSNGSNAGAIINNDFFGAPAPVYGNTFWVKIAGVWKQATGFIKVAGSWKSFEPKIKSGGTWQ
jgi:hypothetical protein